MDKDRPTPMVLIVLQQLKMDHILEQANEANQLIFWEINQFQ